MRVSVNPGVIDTEIFKNAGISEDKTEEVKMLKIYYFFFGMNNT